ncbi:hypothetical protein [Petroclostridium sp. X23]|uniref:hypothetical protein n=1 Tax=Petroclostridium sp. X23 TaxID=3045146 RepID=UPI0024ADAE32|nr:hypothetical protein [Petroclostridium sp. X23]WHH58322.1 hypothetical protein QKW49_21360 [Petroclostridium sp. X23]
MKIAIDRFTEKVTGIDRSDLQSGIQITVPDSFNFTKTVIRIDGEKQKTNEEGQLLYKTNVRIGEDGQEVWDEVTTQEIDGEALEPVMVPNEVQETVGFQKAPYEFTLEEVIQEKYRQALEESSFTHLLADVFLDENDLDIADPSHSANTGVGILQLLPGGQAKTKSITLDQAADAFALLEFDADDGVVIYLAGQPFTDGKLQLTSAVASCTIRFENTIDKPKSVRAYAIGY